jgi:hypothetical protein
MIRKNKIKLNKYLFWDTDPKKIDFKKNQKFVISRVLQMGDLDDFKKIKKYYGLERIKNTAKEIRSLDKKSLNFWSFVFKTPKEEFLCFKTSLKNKQDPFLSR